MVPWCQCREQVRHEPPPSCLYRITCRRPKAGTSIDVPLATLLRDRPTASVDDQRSISNSFVVCLLFYLPASVTVCTVHVQRHTSDTINTDTQETPFTLKHRHLCPFMIPPLLLLRMIRSSLFSLPSDFICLRAAPKSCARRNGKIIEDYY